LNPARATCFDLSAGTLSEYAWSSFPQYLNLSRRADWLAVDRTLGNYGLQDDAAGRRAYEVMMQKRVSEVANSDNPAETDAQWSDIRRGWCFGGEAFRSEMVESLDGVLTGKRRESFVGDQTRQHDVLDAERLVVGGLKRLNLKDSDLATVKKGDPRKKVIAWVVRKNTSVRNDWIAERLMMGNSSNLSRQVHEVEIAENGELFQLREMTK